jgi:release factor glutamine methyltransferase
MPVLDPPQTVSDALHTATIMLERATASPRLDAELLLEHVTGLSRTAFRAAPERELPAQAGWAFRQLVTRRVKGEPIAYIRAHQEFWSLVMEVTPAVLIPRPETELVVERALSHVTVGATAKIADLGTGSGAIALAIASERPDAQIVATDYSEEALHVARRNAGRLQQLGNVSFRKGSWYEPLSAETFHLVVSNPPYIAEGDPDLMPEVLRHEPTTALISGPNGLEALGIIVRGAPAHLLEGGWLIVEHGWKQAAAVRSLFVETGFSEIRSHADLGGHERVTEGRRG